MIAALPRRITAAIWGVAALFALLVLAAALAVTAQMRDQAVSDSEGQAARFVSSAEAALNRSLLSVDLLLTSTGDLLQGATAATVAADANQPVTARLIQGIARQNLLVRYVALLTPQGTVIASSDRRGTRVPVALPDGFLQKLMDQGAPDFIASAPTVSTLTSQRVVYFARGLQLADGSRIAAVAEVQVSLLTTILAQGNDIDALEITLEQDGGPMLASVPPRDDLSGKPIFPTLREADSDGAPSVLPARLTGQPAIVVARPTLHRNLLIVASIPLAAALQEWGRQRAFILAAAAFFALMAGVVGSLTHMHLARQWRSRTTLDRALASMTDGFVLLDAQNRILTWNQRFIDLIPWAGEVIAPLVPYQSIIERGLPHLLGNRPLLAAATPMPGESELNLRSGRLIVSVKSRTPDGGMVCTYHDITEKRQRAADIVAGKAQLQATLDALPDVLLELGLDGMCHGFHAPRVTDTPTAWPDDPVGRSIRDLLAPDAAAEVLTALQESYVAGASAGRQFERRGTHGTGWFEISVARKSIGEGGDARFVVLLRDVSERKSAAREIEHLAFYDRLTGLPNRNLLLHRLKETIAGNLRHGHRSGALLFIDLDAFKTLNDAHGHAVGDELLKHVGMRLLGTMRDGDMVARLGGDEFVVLLEDLHEDALVAMMQTKSLAEAMLAEIHDTAFEFGHGQRYHGTCSIGATLFSGDVASLEDLLKQADIAMYAAKSAGGNALRFFEAAMQTTITARATLESELHAALAADQFTLHYQRQVDGRDRVVGAEVLIRWRHPHRGLLPPAGFIEVAEETGLIVPIGLWVLEQACLQLERWSHDPRRSHLTLAVNVSARQFRSGEFDEQVRGVLIRTGANPRRLKLELTESLLQDKLPETIPKMKSLAAIGIQFSMDDFGTGYSSLSYMAQLPFHQVKIDKFFVQGIGSNAKVELLIQTIIGMARSLDLDVVAEGVETEEQLHFLEQHGCTRWQGYLFGKPVAFEEFDAALPNGVVV